MWQHHYVIHQMHMEELRAEADRERRWHLQDLENGRRSARPGTGPRARPGGAGGRDGQPEHGPDRPAARRPGGRRDRARTGSSRDA